VLFAFEDFVFDEAAFELRKSGKPIKVDAKALDALSYLLRHPGRLVTKEELRECVWQGQVLSDNVLSVTMTKLRKALGDGPKGGAGDGFIVNVYGRGYRFPVAVSQWASAASEVTLTAAPDMAGPPQPRLVGREHALSRVVGALARARGGRGQIAAITGEPGIGKTHLAEAVATRAADAGIRSAWAHVRELETEPPFGPWIRLLGTCSRLVSPGPVQNALGEAASLLVPRSGIGPEWETGADAQRVLESTSRALYALCGERPWLLVFDDLQWADLASLHLLSGIAQELAHLPLLIQLTVRDTEAPGDPSRTELLDQILGHRNTERVALERLTEAEVSEYAAACLGTVDAELGREVFARSEGNPFFMVELLRPFGPSARPRKGNIELSGPVLDVVRRRLRQLTEDVRQTLSAAAVIGREFDVGLLAAVTGRDARGLLDTLDVARATQIIREAADRPGHFAFGHDILRSALVESFSPGDRGELHLRVARALESRHPTGDGVPRPALVHHLLAALPMGDLQMAVDFALRTAQAASSIGAHDDAGAVLRRALAALDLSSDPEPRLRGLLLFGLARCARATGKGDVMGAFREAVSIARAYGIAEVLVLAGTYMSPMPGSPALPGAREVLEAAQRALPPDRKDLHAEVLAHLAWTPPYDNDTDAAKAAALVEHAQALARESGSARALAAAFAAKLYLMAGPDSSDVGEALFDQVEGVAVPETSLHRPAWAAHANFTRMVVALGRGDLAAMERAMGRLGSAAQELKNVELQWHHDRVRVVQRMNLGAFSGVGDALTALRQRGVRLGVSRAEAIYLADSFVLIRETAEAEILAPLADSIALEEGYPPPGLARNIRALAEAGAHGRARAALRQMAGAGLEHLAHDRDYMATLAHLAVASVATGCLDVAARIGGLLAPYSLLYAADISLHAEGSVARFLGLVASALGRAREAIGHFELALTQDVKAGFSPMAEHSRYELACALARSGEVQRVRALVAETLHRSRELGMQPLTQKAEQFAGLLHGV
jgi:DNA-binding winged helix-turn-helix (wHTH) protein/tetratricopeptide (TPR) repeat protein